MRRRRKARRGPYAVAERSGAHFPCSHLHGGGQVERAIRRVRGDRRNGAALGELGIREPRHLGSEHQRDVRARRHADRRAGGRAQRQHAARELAGTSGKADRHPRTGQRVGKRRNHLRRVEHRRRAGRERGCVRIGKPRGRDEHQARKSHRVHRTRCSADVRRQPRVHEHDAQAGKPRIAFGRRVIRR